MLTTLQLSWPESRVALITLTRAHEMNTLSVPLLDEFGQVLDDICKHRARALIITGTGRAFCCGAHLKYFAEQSAGEDAHFRVRDDYLTRIALLFDRLEALPFPVIAAINGYALGGGCELALACDFRIMADDAKLGLPETKLGAIAGAGGVQKLARHIGKSKAMEWILLATHASAAEAERFGLLYAVVPGEDLLPAAFRLVGELKKLSPMAIAQSKAAVNLSLDTDLRSARKFGLEALCSLVGSRDWKIGMQAFNEKRAPEFD